MSANFGYKIFFTLLMALYPMAVFFGLQKGISIRWLAIGLILILFSRWGNLILKKISIPALMGILLVLFLLAWRWGEISVLYYPVAMNLCLLVFFAASLFFPPSVIEKLARLRQPELDEHGVEYTRSVTQVWCGFFILNGSIALVTVQMENRAVWAFYNGVLSYLLMGLLFGGEWIVRQRVMKSRLK